MKSSLATGELLAPVMTNTWGTRPGKVTKFTPHCVVGQLSAKRVCEILNAKGASANYVIGVHGEIWCNVPEEIAPGTSSSKWNDQQAITVECASDLTHPYAFNDKVWASLVKLAKDISKRHGFKIEFTGNQNGSLTYHRMFAATACPGQWFIDNTARFIKEVNGTSGGLTGTDPVTPPTTGKLNAKELAASIARGDFGNAPARWDNLAKAGYTQAEINAAQAIVNGKTPETPSKPSTPSFDANALAKRIAAGEFGNAPARWTNLANAGFTQDQINQAQSIIDKGAISNTPSKPSTPAFDAYDLARKMARGDFGNGEARTKAVLAAGYTENQRKAAQNLINQGKV